LWGWPTPKAFIGLTRALRAPTVIRMSSEDDAVRADRRNFLRASATIGGGFILQIMLPPVGARTHRHTTSQPAAINAYVRIAPDGRVTMEMPKVEMGQGTFTSLPMLLAEELEVALEAISIEYCPVDPAIYGISSDKDMATGGSTSVRDCWPVLRKAGAAARMMLIEAS